MTYYLPLADGSWGSFEDNVPRAAAIAKVWDYNNPAPPPPPVGKPYFAFGAGIDRTQALGYSALEGIGRATGLEGMADWARGGVEANLAAAAKGLSPEQQQTFTDANSVTDYLKAAGQAFSATALPTAVGIGGGLIGGSLAGPAGALAGAVAGGTAAALPLTYGQHRETQKEANPGQPVDEGAAFLAAVPAAAADAVVNRAMFGIGKAVGISAAEVGATLLPRVAKGIGVGTVSEVPAEVFQEVLDRAQSGQALLSPDAMAAYKESAMAAAAVGGVTGGGAAAAFGKRPAAPGSRGEDAGIRGAVEDYRATEPPPPPPPPEPRALLALPEPTVTVPASTVNEPGVDTGGGFNTASVPLRLFTNYAVLKFSGEMTTAVDAALTAHRETTGDPNAVLSPEALRIVHEATAVKIAEGQMATAAAAAPGAAVDKAQKALDVLKATPATGSIDVQMKRFNAINEAEANLNTAVAAKAAFDAKLTAAAELTEKRKAAAELATQKEADYQTAQPKIHEDAAEAKRVEAVGGPTADALNKFNAALTAATPVGPPQDMDSIYARGAEANAANKDLPVSTTAERSAGRGFADEVTATPPLTLAEQMKANKKENLEVDAGIAAEDARLATERAVRVAKETLLTQESEAATDQKNKNIADAETAVNLAREEEAQAKIDKAAADAARILAAEEKTRGDAALLEAARRTSVSEAPAVLSQEEQFAANTEANRLRDIEAAADQEVANAERKRIAAEANLLAMLRAARGAQASTRPGTAPPGAGTAQTTTGTADAAALTARRDKALAIINDRLEKMRARGAQGTILADYLEAELKRGVLTPAELYMAFQASSMLAIQLPAGANHDIMFVPSILKSEVSPEALAASGGTDEATIPATRTAPTKSARGLIKLSLEPQFASFMQESAAHEAFHVVQDYIASYDPSAVRQIKRDFRDGMSLADVDGTLRRKLELASTPKPGESYWSALQKSYTDRTFSSGEMQAVIFGALADANRRGVPMTGLKPSYTRLVLALRQFFQRLGGVLRADGFTNTADMLNLLGEGSARRFDARAVPLGTGATQASTRAGVSPAHAATIAKVVGNQTAAPRDSILARMGRTISGAAQETSIYGGPVQPEKFWDALIRNASNIAQPFYILQNTLNRAGKFIGGPDVGRAIEQATMTATHLEHLLTTGHIRYDKATRDFVPVADTKGVIEILTPVGTSQAAQDEFQTYSVALRERDHRASRKPNFFNLTDSEIATVIRESERAHPGWKAVAADLQTYNDSLMDLMVDSGLITRAQAANLKSMFYTPFYRQMETDAQKVPGQAIGATMTHAINNPEAFAQPIKGGVAAVEPLYASLTKNASSLLRAASKNIAMQAATDAMLAGDLARREKTGSTNLDERTISFYRNGVQEHYFISDPVLWASIASAPAKIRTGMAVYAANIARFTRGSITAAPSFLMANLWKGKHIAYVQEGAPFLGNTLRGVKEAYMNSASAQAFKISTGFGTEMYGASNADVGKYLARQLRRADGTSSFGDNIKNAWEHVQKVSAATELAERLLLREHQMAQGKTAKDAAWQAYLMAPFSRGGAGGGLVGSILVGAMPYIPFLNAKVQGLTRLGQIAAEPGGGQKALGMLTSRAITAVAMRGAMLGVFSMAAAMFAQSEDPKKWDAETTLSKTNNDIFYLPGDLTLYLPRAFEVGFVFGAVPVMIYDALRKGSSEGLAKAFGMGMLNTFGFSALPIPAAIAPLASTITNFDFLRFAPLTNANQMAKAPEDRSTPTTSGIAKLIGSIPGAGSIGFSPINVEEWLKGYLGTTGTIAINLLSDLGSKVGSPVHRPSGAFGSPESGLGLAATLAGFHRFVKTDTQKGDKFVTDFYEMSRELQQAVRTINDAKKIGDAERVQQVYAEHGPILGAQAAINRRAEQLSELNSRIDVVRRHPTLSTQEKDDMLRELMTARHSIARDTMTALRAAGV